MRDIFHLAQDRIHDVLGPHHGERDHHHRLRTVVEELYNDRLDENENEIEIEWIDDIIHGFVYTAYSDSNEWILTVYAQLAVKDVWLKTLEIARAIEPIFILNNWGQIQSVDSIDLRIRNMIAQFRENEGINSIVNGQLRVREYGCCDQIELGLLVFKGVFIESEVYSAL